MRWQRRLNIVEFLLSSEALTATKSSTLACKVKMHVQESIRNSTCTFKNEPQPVGELIISVNPSPLGVTQGLCSRLTVFREVDNYRPRNALQSTSRRSRNAYRSSIIGVWRTPPWLACALNHRGQVDERTRQKCKGVGLERTFSCRAFFLRKGRHVYFRTSVGHNGA